MLKSALGPTVHRQFALSAGQLGADESFTGSAARLSGAWERFKKMNASALNTTTSITIAIAKSDIFFFPVDCFIVATGIRYLPPQFGQLIVTDVTTPGFGQLPGGVWGG